VWGVACACLPQAEGVAEAARQLPFPLFVKPNTAGDSLGIDHDSLVYDTAALLRKASALIEAYGAVLIETYIAGRECTVLVYADPDQGVLRMPSCRWNFAFQTGSILRPTI
jgi:D-alanine-D-alanine ligase-like ATP-grasp enzyme